MKLGNYFQKPVPVARKSERRIVVTNEGIKKDFDKQLKEREKQIADLKVEIEEAEKWAKQSSELYDDIQKRHAKALDSIRQHEEMDAEVFGLRSKVGELTPQAEKVGPLEQQLQQTKETLTQRQTEQTKYLRDLELLQEQTNNNQQTIEQLQAEAIGNAFELSKYQGDYTTTLEEKEYLQRELNMFMERSAQQAEDINLLSTNFFYWKDTAQDLDGQLKKEANLRDEIQRSLDIISAENQLEGKKTSKTSKAYKEAQEIILALNKRNVELTEFTDQMSKIIIEQRKSLATAGYMSQGAIAAKEGFHIPFAKEGIRRQQLGNALPTLLKFKEIDNDNS
tara:strand:+ start:736 stop:1746 length:1011 start_codon:yes stop_codon:yes gene_type:complete